MVYRVQPASQVQLAHRVRRENVVIVVNEAQRYRYKKSCHQISSVCTVEITTPFSFSLFCRVVLGDLGIKVLLVSQGEL